MKLRANAKINLSLDVTGKREDGYHTLCSVFQSVSLCDFITVELDGAVTVRCSDGELNGRDNLCFKAAELFYEASKMSGGANIYIEKHIPKAGGLGGGSADAAAVLVALNELNGRPLDKERLLQAAVTLGADVPFCAVGGTVLCEGIGEIMTCLPPLAECFILITKKGEKSSTGDMYRTLDKPTVRRHPDTERILRGLDRGDIADALQGAYNCFESVTDIAERELVGSVAGENSAVYCGLSGAGPSIVSVFLNKSDAEAAAKALTTPERLCFVCTPRKSGIEIIE